MKVGKTITEVISDENIELMRDRFTSIRDLAMLDLLYATGMRVGELGRKLGIEKVHPHKFRRTMATRAIDKGMPIE